MKNYDLEKQLGIRSPFSIWHVFIPFVLLLSAVTADRAAHLLWSFLFFLATLAFIVGLRDIKRYQGISEEFWLSVVSIPGVSRWHATTMAIFVVFLGSWIPDIDWAFNSHRSPLTHSVLPFLAIRYVINNSHIGNVSWNKILLPLFGIALGSHLIVDFFQGGNLVSIPAPMEFSFYFANGIFVIYISYKMIKQQHEIASNDS